MAFRRAIFRTLAAADSSNDEVRSIPELVKFNAEHNPDHIFCLQHDSRDASLKSITHRDLDIAVDNCIHGLLNRMPGISPAELTAKGHLSKANTVALMLESGIGFFVHMVALLSLGIPVAILSARLSTTSIQSLLRETGARAIITSQRLWNDVSKIDCYVHIVDPLVIDLNFKGLLFQPTPVLEDDCNCVIFHSSGTTGLPKAIRHPQRYILAYAACHEFEQDEEVSSMNVSTLPLYHGFGMLAPALSLSVGMPFCFPSAFKIPTAEYTVELLRLSSAKSLMTVPSILEDLRQSGDGALISEISGLDFVAVGGGPMKANIAEDLVSRHVRLLNHFGATELGALAPIFSLTKVTDYDWRYLRLRRDLGLRLVPLDSDRNDEHQYYQLTAKPIGQESDWSLKDLIQLREGNSRDIKILSRNDDIIVLSNGEKVMPQRLELVLSEIPGVKAALAFGSGQFEIGVLIELSGSPDETLPGEIWRRILQVNQETDSHAQVLGPDGIIILPEGRKFPRSDKGSIMRAEAYKLFKDEIETVYRQTGTSSVIGVNEALSDEIDPKNLRESLRRMVERYLPTSNSWGYHDDIFELGLDSLRAARLHRLLSANLTRIIGTEIHLTRFLYRNSTIETMAVEIEEMLSRRSPRSVQPSCSPEEIMQALLSQFQLGVSIPDPKVRHMQRKSDQYVVLLTGSTGSIGSHLLARLLEDRRVHEVICVDRPRGPIHDGQRQKEAFRRYGLEVPPPEEWRKLTSVVTDTKKDRIGRDEVTYTALTSRVTHIIHNAWPMDFNRTVSSFRGQLETLHNLLQLSFDSASQQQRPIRFVQHSSISVLANHCELSNDNRKALEVPIGDCRIPSQMGYAQAKWLCEKIVEDAAQKLPNHLDASIIRIGQISGSTKNGIWNEKEHVPALLKMARTSGYMPNIEGTLSWLPVDIAAIAISQIVLRDGPVELVYHVENPYRQNWNEVLHQLGKFMRLPQNGDETASFGKWLDEFEKIDNSRRGDAGMELMPFFRGDFTRLGQGLVMLDTRHASDNCPLLGTFGPVTVPLLEKYVRYWKSIDFL